LKNKAQIDKHHARPAVKQRNRVTDAESSRPVNVIELVSKLQHRLLVNALYTGNKFTDQSQKFQKLSSQ